jgi:hypothetical protein
LQDFLFVILLLDLDMDLDAPAEISERSDPPEIGVAETGVAPPARGAAGVSTTAVAPPERTGSAAGAGTSTTAGISETGI